MSKLGLQGSAPEVSRVVQPRRADPQPAPPRKPRTNLPWLVVALLVGAIGLTLLYRGALPGRKGPATFPALRTLMVNSGTLEQSIRLTGSTIAENSVLLRAPYLRGRRSRGPGDFGLALEQIAPSGRKVKKNDLVATFDRVNMLNRLDDLLAERIERALNLEALRANIELQRVARQQQIRAAKAKVDTAALDLRTAPVRSAIQAAQFQLALEEARANHRAMLAETRHVLASEEAQLRLAQLELRESELEERRAAANVDKLEVRAPVQGLVVIREILRGAEHGQIQAGDQLKRGQPYVQIVDPHSLVVEAMANQVDVERLRIGARAEVHFDGYPDLELPARVYSIGPLAASSGWRSAYVSVVPVFLKLDRLDPHLIPNLTISADVVLSNERFEGIVPREAVFYELNDGQPFVYLQTPSGWEKRELELGLANNLNVGVRSGLSPGDVIAMSEPSS